MVFPSDYPGAHLRGLKQHMQMELAEPHSRIVPLIRALMESVFISGLCSICHFSHSEQVQRWRYLHATD
jgi:hypothetical protein